MPEDYTKTYSIAEIANLIGRPATTVSTWKGQFKEYIPYVGDGTHRRYTEKALQLFYLINRMKEAKEPYKLIRQALADNADEIIVDDNDETTKEPIMNEILNSHQAIIEELRKQREEIEELRKANAQLAASNQQQEEQQTEKAQQWYEYINQAREATQQELLEQQHKWEKHIQERDDKLLETLNAIYESKEKEKLKGFWARLFNK